MSIPEGFKLVPVEPTAEILAELAADAYPYDNSAGKALRRLRGCGVVFPKYEVEAAVGKYQRMLAAAPIPPQAVQPVTMANVMRAYEYACDHPHKYLRGTSNWCAAVAWKLNQLESSAPTPPQPIFDETKERELFEQDFPVPEGLVFDQDRNQYYGAPTYWLQQAQWEAWQKCAQSRAKSVEVGHE